VSAGKIRDEDEKSALDKLKSGEMMMIPLINCENTEKGRK
jgi:hypothetical protein